MRPNRILTPFMPPDSSDDALETLFLPIVERTLPWPTDGALFMGARDGWPLYRQPLPGLVCEQWFRPEVDALQRSGQVVLPFQAHAGVDSSPGRTFPLVLVLPPRQREQARALLANAIMRLQPGGIVIACAPNDEGAKSFEADLARIAGPLRTVSKNRCRVFWSAPQRVGGDLGLLAQWSTLDAPRPVLDGRLISRPGVFAWDRIDAASALLAAHLPAGLSGRAADLGAGHGYLSHELLARCAGIRSLDVYEADARALDLARVNLASFAPRVAIEPRWHDVAAGVPDRYDVIVSNPPFHATGRSERPDIGRRFIAVAAEALAPGGSLWLVANRHLPYESVLDASFGRVRCVTQEQGFKVIEAIKSDPDAPPAALPTVRARRERR
jgi:16S rRNA (guanine1207-N2)-methyltransferase